MDLPIQIGTLPKATSKVVTAAIEVGIVGIPWGMAQLGWIAGPLTIFFLSFLNYQTTTITIRTNGHHGRQGLIYICIQFINVFAAAVGYTIVASISMRALISGTEGKKIPSFGTTIPYSAILFGIPQIILSLLQKKRFDLLSKLSILATAMFGFYTCIGLGLGFAKIAGNSKIGGDLTGILSTVSLTRLEKIWRSSQAVGSIALAFPYSNAILEIQYTLGSPNSKTMKKATLISALVITLFYLLFAGVVYAAFGDSTPTDPFIGFGFTDPFWVVKVANVAIVVHLIGAYQVASQPLFSFIDKCVSANSGFRIVYRTVFVIATTIVSTFMPNQDVAGLFAAVCFWPLVGYYPIQMYIENENVRKWSTKWVGLQMISALWLAITVVSVVGSVAGVVHGLTSGIYAL